MIDRATKPDSKALLIRSVRQGQGNFFLYRLIILLDAKMNCGGFVRHQQKNRRPRLFNLPALVG